MAILLLPPSRRVWPPAFAHFLIPPQFFFSLRCFILIFISSRNFWRHFEKMRYSIRVFFLFLSFFLSFCLSFFLLFILFGFFFILTQRTIKRRSQRDKSNEEPLGVNFDLRHWWIFRRQIKTQSCAVPTWKGIR